MAIENIIGRKSELAILTSAISSPEPEFIAVYGRRRIGKTFLIREYFGDSLCFEIVGIHDASLKEQLKNFSKSMQNAMEIGIKPETPASWLDAFAQLEHFLESIKSKASHEKRILFFDEMPWLNTRKSRFLSSFEHFWNSYASKQKDMILIVCGSAASWMIQNIVRTKGGLNNRITRHIRLLPFSLKETELFFQSKGIELHRYDIVLLYMVMGGVPFYLMQARKGLSSAQIIDIVCFAREGLLRNEFDYLYASLFDHSDQHLKIVNTMRKKRGGMTRNEILESSGIPTGGTATLLLEELEESGFIASSIPLGKKANDALYRISDEFTLFYLDWIKPLGKLDPGQGYWLSMQNDPKRRAWTGYAWEELCLKHIVQIKKALGISNVITFNSPWRYIPKESGQKGVQIDLLIDRKDATMNLCEMKFSESEFAISADYVKQLRQKKEVIRNVTKTNKNIFITFITTFGVLQNAAALEIADQFIKMDQLFTDD